MGELALLGGPKAVYGDPGDMFDWPIVTPEVEEAVLVVLRAGKMSGTDVTKAFEQEYLATSAEREYRASVYRAVNLIDFKNGDLDLIRKIGKLLGVDIGS